MTIEEIIAALLVAHPDDYPKIRRYIAWVKFRRMMHDQFFLAAYWVRPFKKYHWVGK